MDYKIFDQVLSIGIGGRLLESKKFVGSSDISVPFAIGTRLSITITRILEAPETSTVSLDLSVASL